MKFTCQEQKAYEAVEGEIAAPEEKMEELATDTLKYTSDFVKLNRWKKKR